MTDLTLILLTVTGLVAATFWLFVIGMRDRIERMVPKYAKELYPPAGGFRRFPIRMTRLFSMNMPDSVRSEIMVMRALFVAHWASAISFTVCVALEAAYR